MTEEEFIRKFHVRLNEQQRSAMEAVDGPVLLLAVPGSGKTTVLVSRLGYMICCRGIAPEKILTLTYTVAATRDMKERFVSLFHQENPVCPASEIPSGQSLADRMQFRTINGVCAVIIGYFGRMIGRKAYELVTNEKDTNGMLGTIFQQVTGSYATESDMKTARTLIAYIKNMMLDEEQIHALDEPSGFEISAVYHKYCAGMRAAKRMDYDDQMIYARMILQKYPQVLQHFQNMFPYICVDEAQDTSKIQHDIIALLAEKTHNLFMVGDEDQSIYGFRAAYPQALLSFQDRYPEAKVLLMEENYRSNAKIVAAADHFIQKNTQRHKKSMRASRPEGPEIRFISLKGRGAQYSYLAKVAVSLAEEAEKLNSAAGTAGSAEADSGGSPEADGSGSSEGKAAHAVAGADPKHNTALPKTAVLCRDNDSMIPLVDLLERQHIPFCMRRTDLTFFSNRVVNDIRDFIAFAENQKDAELFLRIYYKFGIYMNKNTALLACRAAEKTGQPILSAALKELELSKKLAKSIREIRKNLNELRQDSAVNALNRILGPLGYRGYLNNAGLGDSRIPLLYSLAGREASAKSLVARLDDLQNFLQTRKNPAGCSFILSTIHGSKGLEYDTVYLMDVADGIFPKEVPESESNTGSPDGGSASDYGRGNPGGRNASDYGRGNRSSGNASGYGKGNQIGSASGHGNGSGGMSPEERTTWEEERRLFYVGVTRAKDRLNIFEFGKDSAFVHQFKVAAGVIKPPAAQVTKAVPTSVQINIRGDRNRGDRNRDDRNPKTGTLDYDTDPDYRIFVDNLSEGLAVEHVRYGSGVITKLKEPHVWIQFERASKEKQFALPILYARHLLTEEK